MSTQKSTLDLIPSFCLVVSNHVAWWKDRLIDLGIDLLGTPLSLSGFRMRGGIGVRREERGEQKDGSIDPLVAVLSWSSRYMLS